MCEPPARQRLVATALPHLPARQRCGELMRSKVRGRRRADNSLAPQAADGRRTASAPPHPPPRHPCRHLQPHNEVITGPLLDGRHQHPSSSPLFPLVAVGWKGSPYPCFWHGGVMALTLLVEETVLLRAALSIAFVIL